MRAVVLSGGGVKGSFQVGVLRALSEHDPDYDAEIWSGISVGALNSSKLAEGTLAEKLPELEDIWLNRVEGNKSVWKHHLLKYIIAGIIVILLFMACGFISFMLSLPKWITIIFGILTLASFYIPYFSLTHTHSIYTTEPLKKLIEKYLKLEDVKVSGKKLRIGAVSFTTGKLHVIDEHVDNLIDWIMASSAFPVFFPRVRIMDQYWTDGGVTDIALLTSAIDAGATEIDIILTSPTSSGYYHGLPGVLKQFLRDIDIMASEVLRNDLEARCNAHGKNIKIRIFKPKEQLTSNSLDFDPKKIRRMYNEGKRVTKEILKSE